MQLFVRGNDVKQVEFDQTQSIAEFKVRIFLSRDL
jgi:hypothetical protein